jgi:hypothetical protein
MTSLDFTPSNVVAFPGGDPARARKSVRRLPAEILRRLRLAGSVAFLATWALGLLWVVAATVAAALT